MTQPPTPPTMSPPPPEGLGYARPQTAGLSAVPKVLGIIGIIYGAFGVIVGLFSVGVIFTPFGEGVDALSVVVSFITLVNNALLIVASILLLRYRQLGATLYAVWAAVAILNVVLNLLASFLNADQFIEQMRTSPGFDPAMENATLVGYYGGSACVSVLFLILPIVSLALLTRERVKDSLE